MVKYLTSLLFVLFIGCEMNSEQLIKSENINFENIKFNAVSKDLNFTNIEEGQEVEITKKLVKDWFNNNVKIDGFDGNLTIGEKAFTIGAAYVPVYQTLLMTVYAAYFAGRSIEKVRKVAK